MAFTLLNGVNRSMSGDVIAEALAVHRCGQVFCGNDSGFVHDLVNQLKNDIANVRMSLVGIPVKRLASEVELPDVLALARITVLMGQRAELGAYLPQPLGLFAQGGNFAGIGLFGFGVQSPRHFHSHARTCEARSSCCPALDTRQ